MSWLISLPITAFRHDWNAVDMYVTEEQNKLSKHISKWAATWQNEQSECAPSEDSDQPWHPPSLIRVFAVRMKKAWVLSYPLSVQRRLCSDWADVQTDQRHRGAHFVCFVMSRLKMAFKRKVFTRIGYEPQHDKTNKMTCASSEGSDQSGHPPSLIRVFVVRSVGS